MSIKTGTAAVLAGGKSSRFGNDKAFIPFGNTSLVEHISGRLGRLFENVIVIANDQEKFRNTGLEVFPDLIKNIGPLGGLHAALTAAEADWVFITACDMPVVSEELINKMRLSLKTCPPDAVVAAIEDFIEPFHAFYSSRLLPEIEKTARENPCGLHSFLKNIPTTVVACSDEKLFININKPEDIQKVMLI